MRSFLQTTWPPSRPRPPGCCCSHMPANVVQKPRTNRTNIQAPPALSTAYAVIVLRYAESTCSNTCRRSITYLVCSCARLVRTVGHSDRIQPREKITTGKSARVRRSVSRVDVRIPSAAVRAAAQPTKRNKKHNVKNAEVRVRPALGSTPVAETADGRQPTHFSKTDGPG